MKWDISKLVQRIPLGARAELRKLIEHVLIPAMATLLPWPLYYRILYRLASSERLLYEPCQQAIAGFQAVLGTQPDAEWRRRFRLTLLIDRADAFLIVTRSRRWLNRYVDVSGHWPQQPFMGVTFHYGDGMWSIPHIARSGLRAAFLSIRFDLATFNHQRLLYHLARFRMWTVERAGQATTIYTGGSVAQIRQVLAEGQCVIGLIDVPSHQAEKGRKPVQLLGRAASLPCGLLDIAAASGNPVVAFVMAVNWQTGRRRLDIHPLRSKTPDIQLTELAALLDRELSLNPEAWHLWLCAPRFLEINKNHESN